MVKSGTRRSIFKPDYDGAVEGVAAMPPRGAVPDEGAMDDLEQRIHRAMLTLGQLRGDGPFSRGTFWPEYMVEFADRIEQEKERTVPRRRFKPTPHDVSDMLDALALLEGLRVEYFQLVRYKAMDDFHMENGAAWTDLGDAFGRSDYWAREAYGRAMTQAARRAGLIFTAPEGADRHAVLSVTVMIEGVLFTWLGVSASPMQKLYEIKAANPSPIVDACAVWAPSRPAAKVVADLTKAAFAHCRKHGGWHALNPFDAEAEILARCDANSVPWTVDYLAGEPLEAPVRLLIEDPGEAVMIMEEGA